MENKDSNLPVTATLIRGHGRLVLILIASVVLGASIIGAIRLRNTYALVGGEKISIKQYEDAKKAYKSSINKNAEDLEKELEAEGHDLLEGDYHSHPNVENPLSGTNIDTYTKRNIVLYYALKDSAKNHNVTLEESELESALRTDPIVPAQQQDSGSSPEEVRKAYKKVLGWSEEDLRRYYSSEILKNKLQNYLIETRNVLVVSTNSNLPQTGLNEYQRELLARETLKKILLPWLDDESLDRADIMARIEGYNNQPAVGNSAPSSMEFAYLPRMNTDDFTAYISSSRYDADTNDILFVLTKPRSRTKILASEEGIYTVFWVDGYSGGEFSSWDNYTDESIEGAVYFGSNFWSVNRFLYGIRNPW